MSNILEFPVKDITYITGKYNEPDVVGVQGENISMQFGPDLHNFMLGDSIVSREELIAFVLVTGLYDDILKHDT